MQLDPVAIIHSPYKQKFAIPRQPGLVSEAVGQIEFMPEYSDPNILRDIEQFSHLWLLFEFHQTAGQGWSPLVRPPRLGGNRKMGVFATRSTFRPNAIGMSVVELIDWQYQHNKLLLNVKGIDLLDGTPILDIKPYIPYSDAVPDAKGGFAATEPPQNTDINFSQTAQQQLDYYQQHYPQLEALIRNVLAQDPRPAYKKNNTDTQEYGMTLYDCNIRWQVIAGHCLVLSIEKAAN
ncbi:tRNA (N6-threonylcarbamoyladenosine(37)-N6)-methyltransferase TrmO [Neptunicella sp. SCSIO 80796]|uniref:tRNA (N6-threonylcarbamoyladenosine(37)-N6)-methyltransferase TrmO n=1 Tax=Neptunicella plasticusilytica TaxID=3117012 RepID=UPI003A4E248C